jgi:hypothetical protein
MDWIKTDLSGQLDPGSLPEIRHDEKIVFLGSCFSEHMAAKMLQSGFDVLNNPFGIIFHPVPLAAAILDSLEEKSVTRDFARGDVWLSYDAHSSVHAYSREELAGKIKTLRCEFRNWLTNAKTLIITFGSAHGYRLKQDGLIAANCHKTASHAFKKELSDLPEMLGFWETALDSLTQVNPDINVILTVSPVRYMRDGWVQNNRSKARLFELCECLEKRANVSYFPAFEIVNDLLRDFRYFESDGVHPNQLAVDEVWKVFSGACFSTSTRDAVKEITAFREMERHRLMFPGSSEAVKFRDALEKKKAALHLKYPFLRS